MKINTSSFFLLCFLSFILLVLTYSNHLDAAKSGKFGIETAQQAAKITKSPEYFLNLSLESYNSGQYEKSIKAAEEALMLRPDYDRAYNNICAAYNKVGQWDKAIEAGKKAVELNPGNQLAKNNLAWATLQKDTSPFSLIWREFWRVDYLTPHTINYIDRLNVKNISFMTCLYFVMILLTICFFLFLKPFQPGNLLKSFLLAGTIAGVLFAARMDYTWLMWWEKDISVLSHLSTADKFALIEADNVYGFADEVKKLVPPGERVRLFTDEEDDQNRGYKETEFFVVKTYYVGKIKYHLLPLKLSEKGSYIAVFRSTRVIFNPSDDSLRRNGTLIAMGVKLVKEFGNNTSLYRVEEKRSL